jgi:ferredoxin
MLGARLIRSLIRPLIRLRPSVGVDIALCSVICSLCLLLDPMLFVMEDLGVATIPSSSRDSLVEVTSSVDRSGWLLSVVIENRGKRG